MQPVPSTLAAPVHAQAARRSWRARLRSVAADRMLRSGALSVFDQAIVSGTSFATSVLIGRLCSRAELGTYYLALSVVLFVRGVQEQLVSAPYTVYAQRRAGGDLAAYSGSIFVHQGMLTLLALTALAGLGLGAAAFGPSGSLLEGGSAAVAVLAAMPFLLLREHIRQFAFARFRLGTVIALDAAVAFAQLGGLAVLALTGTLHVASVYAVMGLACLLAGAGWIALGGRPCRFDAARLWSDWTHNWRFGRWMLASFLVGSSAPYVMPWFVAALHGTGDTGVLAACSTLVGLANAFVMGLTNALSPQAAQAFIAGGTAELRRVLWKTAALFLVTLGPFCGLALVAGEWIAVFVYGGKYAGAGAIITVYAAATLASSLAITAGNGLCAMERPSANFAADAVALVATIIAAALLVPGCGVLGAALASLCGTTVDAGIRGAILIAVMRRTLR
jgi:O-antigen/teichoic acid export membrane protein